MGIRLTLFIAYSVRDVTSQRPGNEHDDAFQRASIHSPDLAQLLELLLVPRQLEQSQRLTQA